MADFLPGRQTRTQGVEAAQVFCGGHEAEFVFGHGTQLFPNLPVPIYGVCGTRIVVDAGQKWFEFSFRLDHLLSGNSAAGWTDAGNYFRLEPEWSLDLMNWSAGKFLPAPVPVVDLGGGVYEYWSRAVHPVDSAIKSGRVAVTSGEFGGSAGAFGGDVRNNPFTGLTIAGVALALGGFPYTMPGDAARMQNDLRAFYPTATVTATSAILWQIVIPVISLTSYTQANKVFWPVYLVADMFGVVNVPLDGANLTGDYINAAGVAVHPKAFARLKITAGTRYSPYP